MKINSQLPELEFGSEYVSKFTGVTPRQLQWWDERDVVKPRKVGHRRYYSPVDLKRVSTLVQLRKAGIPLQRCRRLLDGRYPEMDIIVRNQQAIVVQIGGKIQVALKWSDVEVIAVGRRVTVTVVRNA